jgi:hypothetical protein
LDNLHSDIAGWCVARRCAALILASLAFVASAAFAKVVDVIEFHNASLDHYFITASTAEIDALDSGRTPGWTRTGKHFLAHESHVNGTNAVCRYLIPEAHGYSHFFSASTVECAKVAIEFPQFIKESDAILHLGLPHPATGECKQSTQAVYRVWNKRSNHRYVTDQLTRDQMLLSGWVPEGYGPRAVAMCAPATIEEADPATAALPPPCKGIDSQVAVPGGPHGMYVWNPNAYMLSFLQKDVIGKDAMGNFKDPTLCGASLVIDWSSVETGNGVYDWSAVTNAAQPFTDAGLTVNLLFGEATEGVVNNVTPAWVFLPTSAGGAGAASVTCTGQPTMPVYWDPAYEAAWTAFIAAAVRQFSFSNSALAASVGYIRFATGGGAEALVPSGVTGTAECQKAWADAKYSYATWNQHEANIINAMGSQPTDKQIMVSLPQAPGGPADSHDAANKAAAVALVKKVGFSFESLGVDSVVSASVTPGPCNTNSNSSSLHWCQAYTKYFGQVPLAVQPITATTSTTNPNAKTMDITVLLQYGLDNHIQIFELYPEEWLSADSPTWPSFDASKQAQYKAALQATAATLGAVNGQ